MNLTVSIRNFSSSDPIKSFLKEYQFLPLKIILWNPWPMPAIDSDQLIQFAQIKPTSSA
jgi:hypothetical protein